MNDRHRQVEKARRMLNRRKPLLEQFMLGVNWGEFCRIVGLTAADLIEYVRSAAKVLMTRNIPLSAETRHLFRWLGIEVNEPNAES